MVAIKASNHNQLIETSNFFFLMSLAEPYLIEENKIYSSYVSIHPSIYLSTYVCLSLMTSMLFHQQWQVLGHMIIVCDNSYIPILNVAPVG